MSRIMRVAMREFASTALTPGFIIGALVLPLLFIPVMAVIVRLIERAEPPAERGVVAIIDRSAVVSDLVSDRLRPEVIVEQRAEKAQEQVTDAASLSETPTIKDAAKTVQAAQDIEQSVPLLTIETIEPPATEEDLETLIGVQQERLRQPANREDPTRVIALVIIDLDAVEPAVSVREAVEAGSESPFGGYQIFQRPGIDGRTIDDLRTSIVWSIQEQRYESADIPRELVHMIETVNAPPTQEVTAGGTRPSSDLLQKVLPFVLIFLLFMGVMTGGQYLLTTTIEEKSSRVVELLLAAVSPMQLMSGKILGQLMVGLSLVVIYNSMGLVALGALGRADLVSPGTIAFMLVFYLLAYCQLGGFMAAVGAAVTELREAQSLMAPVVLVLMVGFYVTMPVSQDPSALYAVVLSFIPPVSPFVMLTRIASTQPPPLWQSLLAVLVNIIAAYGVIWFAAKIFRVGLLMFGKPPNLRTLIKWVRMA